eukprot:SAG31_NODE_19651_length_595_cov_1.149194_1_plen_57_part_10
MRGVTWARHLYVQQTVAQLEDSHPELAASLVALSAKGYPIGADGRVTSMTSGAVKWI